MHTGIYSYSQAIMLASRQTVIQTKTDRETNLQAGRQAGN